MLFGDFFKKKKGILAEEDINELKELKRKAYMEKAKELVKKQGEAMAVKDIQIIKSNPYNY